MILEESLRQNDKRFQPVEENLLIATIRSKTSEIESKFLNLQNLYRPNLQTVIQSVIEGGIYEI